MAKGLCCAAQAAGDLGKPLIVHTHHKDGSVGPDRCGVCEVGPSCSNPQRVVFKFRFLKPADCHLASGSCKPTSAGIAQYNAERGRVSVSGETPLLYQYPVAPGGRIVFTPEAPAGAPYTLPLG
jgi:hypothetical protein